MITISQLPQLIRDVAQFDDINTVRGAHRTEGGRIRVDLWIYDDVDADELTLARLMRIADALCIEPERLQVSLKGDVYAQVALYLPGWAAEDDTVEGAA